MFEKPKKKNNKFSPLKDKPLRRPGQSLDEKIESLFYDKIIHPLIVIFMFLILMGYEWIRYFFDTPIHPFFLTFVFAIMILYYVIRNIKYIQSIKNLRLGCDGEKAVGDLLETLREKGYKVYHDLIEENFNIDHIIVGPGGVYTIETKTIRKTKGQDLHILFDGINIKIDNFTPSRDPIAQATGQKYWLENFIERKAKIKIKVKPVIIYPGWFVETKLNQDIAEVWVLNEKALPKYLNNEEKSLSSEQINIISSHIESHVRG